MTYRDNSTTCFNSLQYNNNQHVCHQPICHYAVLLVVGIKTCGFVCAGVRTIST